MRVVLQGGASMTSRAGWRAGSAAVLALAVCLMQAAMLHGCRKGQDSTLAGCVIDADCPEGSSCKDGRCRLILPAPPECHVSSDCAEGDECRGSECVPEQEPDAECKSDSECSADEACKDGHCVIRSVQDL